MPHVKNDYVAGDKINASDLNDIANNTNPVGTMLMWATDTAPTDYILCFGQAISRTTFSDLFGVIGTVYGIGDGSTTFNVPDMRGRLPLGQDDMGGTPKGVVTDPDADVLGGEVGVEEQALTVAQLPSHNHGYRKQGDGGDVQKGIQNSASWNNAGTTDNTGSGAAHNNLQPTLTLNYIIKS